MLTKVPSEGFRMHICEHGKGNTEGGVVQAGVEDVGKGWRSFLDTN